MNIKRRNLTLILITWIVIATLTIVLNGCQHNYTERIVKHKVISKEIVYNPASVPIWPHRFWKVALENGDTVRCSYMVTIPDSVSYVYLTPIEK
jgi:hypothetical protein